MVFIVSGIANSYFVAEYLDQVKNQVVWNSKTDLVNFVHTYAQKNNQLPIEPKIDPVWKLIPGYNGLIVDEETTIKSAIEGNVKSLNDLHFIWKEIEPKTKINELKPYPIYRGNPQKSMVSLMINVAWGTEHLDSILKTLEKDKVRATFFFDGSWVKKNPEMARRIVSEGHEVGNHAYSHPLMSRLTNEKIKEELQKTEKIIYQTTKHKSTYFAPPSGDYDQRVVDIAANLHLRTVLWTIDTIDWQKSSPDAIIERIIPKIDKVTWC
ncbi:polysaccharide deacetylase family protein [Tepidibacillus fermentans]|uniref:Putative sporulation protein (Polysaccharide deacetylase family) n=1 Tax=Tepidibacillus fermentans TaxID=1281767 RepID=A0A4R3KI38_9BACI|nr:polysaccharide deacetylase family protein [Tepidibacillus fermentans]TCS82991.1 putative sporulation protein (polysaccharide deacetylase family) [Tepidibacillus fermentans]